MEENRKRLLDLDSEVKAKVKKANDMEYYVTQKMEEVEASQIELREHNERLEREKRELMLGYRRLEDKLKKNEENSKIIERERENLIKIHNEIETEKVIVNSEKMKIEQQYADIRIRMQSIDVSLS